MTGTARTEVEGLRNDLLLRIARQQSDANHDVVQTMRSQSPTVDIKSWLGEFGQPIFEGAPLQLTISSTAFARVVYGLILRCQGSKKAECTSSETTQKRCSSEKCVVCTRRFVVWESKSSTLQPGGIRHGITVFLHDDRPMAFQRVARIPHAATELLEEMPNGRLLLVDERHLSAVVEDFCDEKGVPLRTHEELTAMTFPTPVLPEMAARVVELATRRPTPVLMTAVSALRTAGVVQPDAFAATSPPRPPRAAKAKANGQGGKRGGKALPPPRKPTVRGMPAVKTTDAPPPSS